MKQSVFCGFLSWAVSACRQEAPKSLVVDTVHPMITLRSRVNALPLVGWQPFAIWRASAYNARQGARVRTRVGNDAKSAGALALARRTTSSYANRATIAPSNPKDTAKIARVTIDMIQSTIYGSGPSHQRVDELSPDAMGHQKSPQRASI